MSVFAQYDLVKKFTEKFCGNDGEIVGDVKADTHFLGYLP